MKNVLSGLFVVALFFCVLSSARAEQLVGGYADVGVTDAGVQEAAQAVAKATNSTVVKITKAQQQVVAGMNYQLDLTLKGATGENSCTATVYKDLKGVYKVTKMEAKNQPDAAPAEKPAPTSTDTK